jgi:predicted dehydrogenase
VRWTETRNMEAFVQLLSDKKVDVTALITHRFPVERAQSAYELITGKSREPFLGVVIQYAGSAEDAPSLAVVPKLTGIPKQRVPINGVSVGLLGAGVFATGTLLPALKASSKTTLITVCAATGSHAQHAQSKFGFRQCTTDETQVMKDPAINTIVIATRHHLHAEQVLAALAAGKNVFCEKPLCLTEEELQSIVAAYFSAPASERPALTVGFNRRFAPMAVRLKSFLSSIREPLALHYRVNAGSLPLDHWVNDREQGGGRILGELCHFVDLLSFLAGSPICEVEARALGNSGRYSGDNVIVSIRLANGSDGTISYLANGDRSFSKERIEVFGGGGAAVLEDFRRLELVRNGRKEVVHSRWRQDKGHRAEWDAFAYAVEQRTEAPIGFAELVSSTLATLRVDEAVASGKRLTVDGASFLNALQRTSATGAHRE